MIKGQCYFISFYLFTFLFTLTLSACDTTEPQLTSYHNKILFTSYTNTKAQLYMMNPDGSDIQQIINDKYWHYSGRWSPDASRILCNTEENSTTAGDEMAVMNPDGSNKVFLGYGFGMSWSPDGKQIAFVYLPSAEWGAMYQFIYVINADGTNLKQITSDSLEEIGPPCWSKDGSKIYFSSNRNNSIRILNDEIYYMNSDGTNVTRLTNTSNGSSYSPSVSTSGNKLLFMSTMGGATEGSIYISDINGNNAKLIVTPPSNEVYNYPRWSPDGKSLVFVGALTDGSAKTSIYKISIDGANLLKLADNANYADWSK